MVNPIPFSLKVFISACLLVVTATSLFAQSKPIYKDPAQPTEARVQDLLKRMNADEKFWQLYMIPGDLEIGKKKLKNGIFGFEVDARGENNDAAGQMLTYGGSAVASQYAAKVNGIQKFFMEESRLGIPMIAFAESLHGLGMGGCTSFPQSIGLAATWDTVLMNRVANCIALEVNSRGIRQVLDPVINIARDVRWGRVEETYGEDPYLTSLMGICYMQAFERLGVIATPKHFAVNSGDGGRDSYPIHYNERLLEEIYFPAFKTGFQKAGARSVMSAYNSLDGSPCTSNDWLLNKKLKKEWGFNGFVISDACAVGGANVLHYTAADYAEATADALNGGLDVIFQTDYDHHTLFKDAFDKGMIPQSVIDSAVARVLRVKFELGLFENPYVDAAEADRLNGSPEHRAAALQAAREAVVLLQNDNKTLPLSGKLKKIAVIGTDATEARLGGYSGPGINKVSIFQGLCNKVPVGTEVQYSAGCGRSDAKYVVVPSSSLLLKEGNSWVKGLKAEYFDNISLAGLPKFTRKDEQVNFGWTLYSPDPALAFDWYSVRWTGEIEAPESGIFKIGVEGNDGYRLYIDGKLLIDNWQKKGYSARLENFIFEKGKHYDLKLEYFESSGSARIKLVWDAGMEKELERSFREALSLAENSDAVVMVCGINEGEFNDRALLSLPGAQERLIHEIAAKGKPVTVVLIGGSAILTSSWNREVGAIVDAWYPGEAGGEAVAEILLGMYNPGGRLPITFPVTEGQLPLVYNHKPTGRGDDYTDLTGMPLYPFGFGLSYTNFEYSNFSMSSPSIQANEKISVKFTVRNAGSVAGDEVCQLYIRDELASVTRPVKELKGFTRVSLAPGESKEITFTIGPDELSMLDKDLKTVVEPGDFRIMIGASSTDIRLRGILSVLH
ncbi:MAG: glycoside hydrolase family 3 C-terminal domain-containing protein [Bacteroidales bacterium]|nr:glycoside hydrolase family 3 C-terminal domain-containing protein [Bacteroidales bacterium]